MRTFSGGDRRIVSVDTMPVKMIGGYTNHDTPVFLTYKNCSRSTGEGTDRHAENQYGVRLTEDYLFAS
jgi:hypothetical protein